MPWDALHSKDRSNVLENSIPFSQFNSLDPNRATVDDVYTILGIALSEQQKNEQPLQFCLTNETLRNLAKDDAKLQDIPKIKSPRKKRQARQEKEPDETYDFSLNVTSGSSSVNVGRSSKWSFLTSTVLT